MSSTGKGVLEKSCNDFNRHLFHRGLSLAYLLFIVKEDNWIYRS